MRLSAVHASTREALRMRTMTPNPRTTIGRSSRSAHYRMRGLTEIVEDERRGPTIAIRMVHTRRPDTAYLSAGHRACLDVHSRSPNIARRTADHARTRKRMRRPRKGMNTRPTHISSASTTGLFATAQLRSPTSCSAFGITSYVDFYSSSCIPLTRVRSSP